jgi:diacylglycerol kinase (ATP)
VSDGLLDVIVVRKGDLASILSLTADVLGGRENHDNLLHWQAQEVKIVADPPQPIQGDGELFELDPVEVKVLPQALQIVVPSPDRENR